MSLAAGERSCNERPPSEGVLETGGDCRRAPHGAKASPHSGRPPSEGSFDLIERPVRVVAVERDTVWFEAEPGGGCGACAAMASCGSGKFGGGKPRRFEMAGAPGLRVGDRVILGLAEGSLLRAAATAFAIPLAGMLGAGIIAWLAGGGDGETALASIAGLGVGVLLARLCAGRLSRRGDFTPVVLRRERGER
ncbi:MAG: SoxR reducing system RseC family protein [Rhodospirillaceae bacterium]